MIVKPQGFHLRSGLLGFAAGLGIAVLSAVAIVPASSRGGGPDEIVALQSPAGGGGGPGPTIVPGRDGSLPQDPGGTSPGQPSRPTGVANPAGLQCAPGKNGGATDTGVTDTGIKLGATVVDSGIGQAFLGEVRLAMEALRAKVNGGGGVCGRKLTIKYKDDGWDPQTGYEFIRNLVEGEKVFSLAVVPSSEGLNQASGAHYFEQQKVPVVGSDGMIRSQYRDPYIWPVATSTVSMMHIIAKNAWDRGARKFAIVYESSYRFGIEGAYAFEQAFERLTPDDEKIPGYANPLTGQASCNQGSRFCGIPSGQGQYNSPVAIWNQACGRTPVCDFGAMLLEPKTALDWMNSGSWQATANPGAPGNFAKGMGAAQPLFTYDFGAKCGEKCNKATVWTGYNPPIEEYANQPAIVEFTGDIKAQSSRADVYNQFTEGGYLGMKLLIAALEKAGPSLTRETLKAALDSMTLNTGLSNPLSWRAGDHFANRFAQGFEIQAKGGFSGWRKTVDYVEDPWIRQDVS